MTFSLGRHFLLAAIVAGVALPSPAGRAQEVMPIVTGGTSGVYYPLGVALAGVYSDTIKNARFEVHATKASVENLNLLQQGKAAVAFALGDSIQLAWEGDAEAGFPEKLTRLRGLASLHANYIHIVTAAHSGIEMLADLEGKSLSVGALRSGTELNARQIFEAAGMSYEDLHKVEYLSFADSVTLIQNHQLDAALQSAGLGVSALRSLAGTLPIRLVSVPSEVIEKLGPPYEARVIPGNTYEGQTEELTVPAIGNYLVTHEYVSDDLAYQMTRQLFANRDSLLAAHGVAREITLSRAHDGMPVPLHPGAARFYKEQGLL